MGNRWRQRVGILLQAVIQEPEKPGCVLMGHNAQDGLTRQPSAARVPLQKLRTFLEQLQAIKAKAELMDLQIVHMTRQRAALEACRLMSSVLKLYVPFTASDSISSSSPDFLVIWRAFPACIAIPIQMQVPLSHPYLLLLLRVGVLIEENMIQDVQTIIESACLRPEDVNSVLYSMLRLLHWKQEREAVMGDAAGRLAQMRVEGASVEEREATLERALATLATLASAAPGCNHVVTSALESVLWDIEQGGGTDIQCLGLPGGLESS